MTMTLKDAIAMFFAHGVFGFDVTLKIWHTPADMHEIKHPIKIEIYHNTYPSKYDNLYCRQIFINSKEDNITFFLTEK